MTLEAIRASLVSLITRRATQVAELDKAILWASNGVMVKWLYNEVNTYDREKVRFKFYARMFLNSED